MRERDLADENRRLRHQLKVACENIETLKRLPGADRIQLKRSPYG